MKTIDTYYIDAITRNLRELDDAILMKNALSGLNAAKSLHALDFFHVSAVALYNDTISHILKVFEIDPKPRSFWYIVRNKEQLVNDISEKHSISTGKMKDISERLKIIRNKTHFHIDSKFANKSDKVWQLADIKFEEIEFLLKSAHLILSKIYNNITGKSYDMPVYDGTDAINIIQSYVKANPDVDIVI